MASSLAFMLSRCLQVPRLGIGPTSCLLKQIRPMQSIRLQLPHRSFASTSWIRQNQATAATPPPDTPAPSPSAPGPAPPQLDADGKPISRISQLKAASIRYWKNLLMEYKIVLVESYEEGLANPARSTCYLILVGGVIYLIWSNPTEDSFHIEFTLAREDFDLVGEPVRSPKSEQYIRAMSRLHNRGELRYSDLVLMSVVWRHDHDKELGLFEAQCNYLKPAWSEMWDRLIDVGIAGRWWISRRVMKDYDVNEWEWEAAPPAASAAQASN